MTPRPLYFAFSLLVSLSAAAQLPRNQIAVSAGWTNIAGVGGAQAIGASFNRFLTPMISAEIGGFRADDGRKQLTDYHLGAAFHGFRERTLSPWIGLGVAHVEYRDPGENTHAQVTSIAGAGLDVNLTRSFALGAEMRYSPFVVNPRDRFGFNVNPATFAAAARWRF